MRRKRKRVPAGFQSGREIRLARRLDQEAADTKNPAAALVRCGGVRRNALAAFVTRPQAVAQIGAMEVELIPRQGTVNAGKIAFDRR